MELTSLGYRTDLALLALGGSELEERDGCLVVRTPHNPAHWWGNFLLLPRVPSARDTASWLERFTAEFPSAGHVAFGFDGVNGRVDDLAGFADAGLSVETATVMTATSVHEPPRPNRRAQYRALGTDDDWAQQVELRMAGMDEGLDPVVHRGFTERKTRTYRTLVDDGHGTWFGAFEQGQLVSSMGLFRAGPGLARFQSVETRPEARGRGLAGTLAHYVSGYGLRELGATTLVMVADPDYSAIRVYRSVGFIDTEAQLQAERPPIGG